MPALRPRRASQTGADCSNNLSWQLGAFKLQFEIPAHSPCAGIGRHFERLLDLLIEEQLAFLAELAQIVVEVGDLAGFIRRRGAIERKLFPLTEIHAVQRDALRQ